MMLVVDVAAGRGGLLATILERNPHLRGSLFDLPHVIEDARRLVNDAGWPTAAGSSVGAPSKPCPKASDAYSPSPIPSATLAVKGSDIAAKSRTS